MHMCAQERVRQRACTLPAFQPSCQTARYSLTQTHEECALLLPPPQDVHRRRLLLEERQRLEHGVAGGAHLRLLVLRTLFCVVVHYLSAPEQAAHVSSCSSLEPESCMPLVWNRSPTARCSAVPILIQRRAACACLYFCAPLHRPASILLFGVGA